MRRARRTAAAELRQPQRRVWRLGLGAGGGGGGLGSSGDGKAAIALEAASSGAAVSFLAAMGSATTRRFFILRPRAVHDGG